MMKITREFEFGTVAELDFQVTLATELPSGHKATVDVRGPRRSFGGTVAPAQVNWSAIGSSSPEDTKAYADLMVAAAAEATKMNEWMDEFLANHQD